MSDQNQNQPKIEFPRTDGDVAAELRGDLNDPTVDLTAAAATDRQDMTPLSPSPKPTLKFPQTPDDKRWVEGQDSSEQDAAWDRAKKQPIRPTGEKSARFEQRAPGLLNYLKYQGGKLMEKTLGGDGDPAKWQ